MKKINEVITKVCDTANGKSVDVYAYVEDAEYGEVTLGYELRSDGDMAVMSYGRISTEDPGDVPSREFESRQEAAASAYGECFEVMFDVAEKAMAGCSDK